MSEYARQAAAGGVTGTERLQGAQTAHQLLTRALANGHSADEIAAWQARITASPQPGQTPAQQAFAQGYWQEVTAHLALLREAGQDITQHEAEAG
jgi:hypothetical protein